ncbi:MAG: hypothetical protein GX282_06010 [Campylobacteraceae bacterium]|nr:hypothetical protein [Campylobacteraceae bacterium]
MAIKEDIKDAKKVLDSQSQFLESIVRSELFVKKYKKPLMTVLTVLVVVFVGYNIMNYVESSKFKKANEAYSELLVNPNNEKAKKSLKNSNKNLYTLYEFRVALDNADSAKIAELSQAEGIDPILKDIINYEASKESGEILNSYSAFMSGYALLKEGKAEEANREFLKIPQNSDLSNIANSLRHYSGSKK